MNTATTTGSTTTAAAPVDNVLSVRNIEVIYDSVSLAIKGISLDVPRGGLIALLGANGAGKSTTLRAISGLLQCRPRAGASRAAR